MTALSCKKFKIILTLKRGYKGQFIRIEKNIKSEQFFNTVYSLVHTSDILSSAPGLCFNYVPMLVLMSLYMS